MKFKLMIELEDRVEVISAPTFEILEEKYGAWERSQEKIDTTRVCQFCDLPANGHTHNVSPATNY